MEARGLITDTSGNLLDADVEALVNTVNTVGVMGKGIALQFKRAYPEMFRDYAAAVKRHEVVLGRMHVWHVQGLEGPRLVVNFPTKGHWRARSRLQDVAAGLDDLVDVIRREQIRSIAVPPLGCGHGGLDWSVVEPLIRAKLGDVDDLDVRLYPPDGAPRAAEMTTRGVAPRLTPARVALIETIRQFSAVSVEGATPIAIQKLMYFLEVAGAGLGLRFERHHYGPYADSVRAMLREMEGFHLEGFGDGSQRVELAEPIRVLPTARDDARAAFESEDEAVSQMAEVLDLIDGFESSYGLELLATVHWVATHPGAAPEPTDAQIIEAVRGWSSRKGQMFSETHVAIALQTLRERGWLVRAALPV